MKYFQYLLLHIQKQHFKNLQLFHRGNGVSLFFFRETRHCGSFFYITDAIITTAPTGLGFYL